MINYNIILTGTINVNETLGTTNRLTLVDTQERLKQYQVAIERFIKESVFNKIVFVETSGYYFDTSIFIEMADEVNKQFEYLSFIGSTEEIKVKGKSIGDAEAINYALLKSNILKNENTIYKITGRLFLLNSKRIVKSINKSRNEFFSPRKTKIIHRCKTYFFKFNREDYLTYFFDVPKICDERKGLDMEAVFCKILLSTKIEFKSFKCFPRVTGVVAGLGTNYDKSFLEYIIGDILIKFGFFDVR